MRREHALSPCVERLEDVCPLDSTLSYLPGELIQTGIDILAYTPYSTDGGMNSGPAPIDLVIDYYTGEPAGPTATPPALPLTAMTPGSSFLIDPTLPALLPTLTPWYGGTMAQEWAPVYY
jgi:hypothetical protein